MVRVVPSTQKNVEGLVSLNIKHGLRTASAFLYLSPQSAVGSPYFILTGLSTSLKQNGAGRKKAVALRLSG